MYILGEILANTIKQCGYKKQYRSVKSFLYLLYVHVQPKLYSHHIFYYLVIQLRSNSHALSKSRLTVIIQ